MENLSNDHEKRERARKRVKAISGFYRHLLVYVLINIFLLILKYVNLEAGEAFFRFSTFSTAFFWGIGLAFHALGVFSKNILFGSDWEERKIRQIMDKDKKQRWE